METHRAVQVLDTVFILEAFRRRRCLAVTYLSRRPVDPFSGYLSDEIVPVVAKLLVPFVGRMDTVTQQTGGEAGKVDGEDALATITALLHHVRYHGLVLLGAA